MLFRSTIINTFKTAFSFVAELVKTIIEPFSLILSVIVKIGDALVSHVFGGLISIAKLIGGALAFPFKLIAKIVGVDTSGVDAEETTKDKSSNDDIVTAIQETNRKLEMLMSLMANGGIAVNLDGRKVSEQLAIASS